MKFFAPVLIMAMIMAAAGSGEGRAQAYQRNGGKVEEPARPGPRPEELEDLRVRIGRLRYGGGGDWYSDPSSLPNLLKEFRKRTGIPSAVNEKVLAPDDPDLFSYPFLYLTGHGKIKLGEGELAGLRRHLLNGGFLYADDNYGMDESFRELVSELFPERELVTVPLDHRIYHSFYDLEGPPKIHEHDGKPPQGLGVFSGNRLIIFYTYESDIGDGLEDAEVHGDPPAKREEAVRLAVNVLYFALTQ
ncbi:MAG: DUF4159 domain-containing protein [Candidatus Krumholzibacteriota bacterium]|nr:DUF4159 domain-containing protein [Candidatus Krumholzibacteriota bacterium]